MSRTIPAPLSGRYVVVMGGSRGIGAAIAIDLARKGAAGIAITYASNHAAAHKVLEEIVALGCSNCTAIKADLLSSDFGTTVVQAALKGLKTDKLHVTVSNAAYSDMAYCNPFEEEALSSFDTLMHANIWAPMQLIRATLPHIPETGRIINISSVASRRANADRIMSHGASKAALDSMTRSLAVKYAPLKKITVNTICVGPTNTEPVKAMLAEAPAVLEGLLQRPSAEKRMGEARDVAGIVSSIASEESRWINGCSVPADGGSMLERQG